MSHKNILSEKSPISQFLFSIGFFLYFSKPVLKHIEQFIKRSTQKGYKGTNNLGLNTYQVTSTKSIDRLLVLISLTYVYCSIQETANNSFGKGLIICRNNVKKNICGNNYL